MDIEHGGFVVLIREKSVVSTGVLLVASFAAILVVSGRGRRNVMDQIQLYAKRW
jgi:hypothetical protein